MLNRLYCYLATYGSTTDPANLPAEFLYQFWFRYSYADQTPSSMPVENTLRVNGLYKEGNFYDSGWRVGNMIFDSHGRLTTGGRRYDANGNVVLDYTTYDNYKNTNKIWMFIDDDYSVNNPFTAITYKSVGLPLTFPAAQPSRVYLDDFSYRQMNILTMQYSCSMVPSGQQ